MSTVEVNDQYPNIPNSAHGYSYEKPFQSLGYKVHNELTYRGVDWLLNTTIAVGFSYWSSRTEMGKNWFSRPLSGVYEALAKPVVKNEAWAKKAASGGMMFTNIMAGGTFIIPIMMYLENKENKKNVIHKIDEIAYSKEVLRNDSRFKEQDEQIDNEPKKDFSTGMAARFAALTPFVAEAVTPPVHETLQHNIYERVGGVSKGIAKSLGIESEKLIKMGEKESMKNGSKRFVSDWDFIHNTIGYDVTVTFVYSYLHELAYKFFAKKKQWHKDHAHGKDETEVPARNPQELRRGTPANEASPKQWQERVQKREQVNPELLASESHEALIASQQETDRTQAPSI